MRGRWIRSWGARRYHLFVVTEASGPETKAVGVCGPMRDRGCYGPPELFVEQPAPPAERLYPCCTACLRAQARLEARP